MLKSPRGKLIRTKKDRSEAPRTISGAAMFKNVLVTAITIELLRACVRSGMPRHWCHHDVVNPC
jgi:hypothetical protein